MLLSSYSRMLMVSRAHVLSANKPDFSDIITLHASGVPVVTQQKTTSINNNNNNTTNNKRLRYLNIM